MIQQEADGGGDADIHGGVVEGDAAEVLVDNAANDAADKAGGACPYNGIHRLTGCAILVRDQKREIAERSGEVDAE